MPTPTGSPRRLARLLAGALALTLFGFATPAGYAEERGLPTPGRAAQDASQARVIVKYRTEAPRLRALSAGSGVVRPQHAQAMGQRLNRALRDGRVLGARMQGLMASGLDSAQLAAELAAQPEVEWAVPDLRRNVQALPNDPYLPGGQTTITPAAGQWYLRTPDATLVSAVDAVGAWDIGTGSPAVTVALLDTGVRGDHPDLAGQLHPGYDFVSTLVVGNDGDARDADPSDPGNATTAGECGLGQGATTSSWHGTQVAGLVGAATNNGIGMAGVGWNVKLLPVRVLGRCGGYDSDIIAAMRWAAGLTSEVGVGTSVSRPNANPARVINLSLGSDGACPASWRTAIAEVVAAGVTVVAAAGNDAGHAVSTPANCPGAIAVAGVRHVGSKVGYSNVGPEVALAAPAGNCVNLVGTCLYPLLTTTNDGVSTPGNNIWSNGDRASFGTSFAAPIVSGTVALMLSLNPSLSPAQVRERLRASARAFPTSGGDAGTAACRAPNGVDQLECYCTTTTCGAGMLSASGAMGLALAPAPGISVASSTVPAGSTITLTSSSGASSGRSIAGYQWSILSGGALASFTGSTTGPTATLTVLASAAAASSGGLLGTLAASGNGEARTALAVGDSLVVQLAVTDNLGSTSTGTQTLTIGAATGSASSGSGGGGANGLPWFLALCGALGLAWLRRRR